MHWSTLDMPVRISWPMAVKHARDHQGFRLGLALFWSLTRCWPKTVAMGYVARPRHKFPELTEPDAQLIRPGEGGKTVRAWVARRLLISRRPTSLLLKLRGSTDAATPTWICFHPRRIWVGSRWPEGTLGYPIGYDWEDRDLRLASAFTEAGHALGLNEWDKPAMLDHRSFRRAGCGARYPRADLFPDDPVGPCPCRSFRDALRRWPPSANGLASPPSTSAEEFAWAFADDLRRRAPTLQLAVHSPSLVANANMKSGSVPDFPPVLVFWNPAKGQWALRLEFEPDHITARLVTGKTVRYDYNLADDFTKIDRLLVRSGALVRGSMLRPASEN